ncbi:MAG: hypothetical protein J3K34DRAFT_29284 [Monoraphidium minutum]|nr:MAG: hypothetical protein J3K34DRAFT_29284 [Monoraphidium minutum]
MPKTALPRADAYPHKPHEARRGARARFPLVGPLPTKARLWAARGPWFPKHPGALLTHDCDLKSEASAENPRALSPGPAPTHPAPHPSTRRGARPQPPGCHPPPPPAPPSRAGAARAPTLETPAGRTPARGPTLASQDAGPGAARRRPRLAAGGGRFGPIFRPPAHIAPTDGPDPSHCSLIAH